jgi:hypothetical protein
MPAPPSRLTHGYSRQDILSLKCLAGKAGSHCGGIILSLKY